MRTRVCLICVIVLLVACRKGGSSNTPVPATTTHPTRTPIPTLTAEPTTPPAPTATLAPTEKPTLKPAQPTDTPVPTTTQESSAPGWQVVQNGGFDSNTDPWDQRLGKLEHTTSEFNTGPGAASVTTNHSGANGDYTAVFGQCIDLSSVLGDWPGVDGQKHFTLEAYLKTGENGYSVSISGLFFEDTRCGNPPSGVDGVFPPSVRENQDWTRVSETVVIPDSARSIDVFFNVIGLSTSGIAYVDDVRAYPSDPDTAQ